MANNSRKSPAFRIWIQGCHTLTPPGTSWDSDGKLPCGMQYRDPKMHPIEPWKKPWFRDYTARLYRDYFINHYKDPYKPTWIQQKVRPVFFSWLNGLLVSKKNHRSVRWGEVDRFWRGWHQGTPNWIPTSKMGVLLPWKLTNIPWKSMVGSDVFPTEIVPFLVVPC